MCNANDGSNVFDNNDNYDKVDNRRIESTNLGKIEPFRNATICPMPIAGH